MLLLFALLSPPRAQTPDAALATADALAEGSALKLGDAARQLAETAGRIAREGHIGHLAPLRADADNLRDRAETLLRVLDEP